MPVKDLRNANMAIDQVKSMAIPLITVDVIYNQRRVLYSDTVS